MKHLNPKKFHLFLNKMKKLIRAKFIQTMKELDKF